MSCRFKTISIGLGCLGLVTALSGDASAQWTKINTQQTSSVALAFGNAVAYNDKSDVYLQAWGHPTVRGRFVDANGNPLFSEFVIAQQSGSDAYVGVSYSAGSADDVFLVTFSSEISGSQVFGRLVRYTAGGALMSPPFRLSTTTGTSIQRAGGSAYDPIRRRFLTTWEDIRGWQIYGRFVASSSFSTSDAPPLSAGEQNLSATNFAQGTPNVAFDPEHNRFLVVFRGNHPDSGSVFGSWGRMLNENAIMVDLNGDGAANTGDVIELSRGGEPAEQNVFYLPEADAFFTLWTEVGRSYDLMARVVSATSTAKSNIIPLFVTSGNEGMADGAYSPSAQKALVVFAREATKFIEGFEISPGGTPVGSFQVGSQVGREESRFPSVAAAENGRFGFGYLNDYSVSWFEVYHSTTTPGGVTTPPPPTSPPPPPPPPPPTLPFGGSATTFTQGAASLLWQHSDGWVSTWRLTGTDLSSATSLNPGRSSDPKWRVAAGGDFNNDGQRDVLWQHDDGWVAVWLLNGNTMTSARLLTPNRVTDPDWRIAATADIDRNGLTDIVWHHRTQGYVATWLMNGTVAVQMQLLNPGRVADTNWRIVGTADLNRDNWTDIVWQHQTNGLITSWLMYGGSLANPGLFNMNQSADPNWKVRALLDANGDGRADLVWQHATKNELAVTLLDGLSVVASAWLDPQTVNAGWRLVSAR